MKTPSGALGQDEMLGQGQPGHQALLQAGSGQIGHALLHEGVVRAPGQIWSATQDDCPPPGAPSPAQARRKRPLPAALHASQADHLARADVQVHSRIFRR